MAATATTPINLKHVLKMYEIAEEGLGGIIDRHLQDKIKKRDENGEKKSSGQDEKPISTHEANFRTWKDIKQVRDLRTRLHNYLRKYESETTKNIYSNQETEETTDKTTQKQITLQQAHNSMRDFSMNIEVELFCKEHKRMRFEYTRRIELELWSFKKGKKKKY
jgi:hypothetical protein